MSETLNISRSLVDEIFAHARSEAPREACGMIGGSASEARAVYPTKNSDTSNVTYHIDPHEAFQVIRRMRADGFDFIAGYHSHPATEAFPSPTDLAKAGDSDLIYVIVSLRRADNSEFRAFKMSAGQAVELEVKIA